MTNKPFKTITQQIAILRDQRHLIFLNEESARQSLMRYGYYEIINGYKDNFMVDSQDDTKGFVSGATFEHIYALFSLDRKLSEAVLSGLADVEATLKTAIAYTIGATIGVDQNLYTDKSIYAIGDLHKKKKQDGTQVSDRDILLRTFKRTLNSKEQPFSHYRNDLGNIPPWIMVKNFPAF